MIPTSNPELPTGPATVHLGQHTREEAALHPSGLLIHTSLPLDRPVVGGVVICSSLHAEFLANYRKEVLVARALAERGMAVVRFDYRGTGNSGGAPEDLTLQTMTQDAEVAIRHLAARAAVEEPSFLGVRFGALVAAGLARPSSARLALWEPVLEADQYFREAFRARIMRELKDGLAVPTLGDALLDELRSKGSVDVLGYTINRGLYDSTSGTELVSALGSTPRRVLLVQIGKRKELKQELRSLADNLERGASSVATAMVQEEEAWWFVGEDWLPEEKRSTTQALLDATVDWLIGAAA